MEKFCFGLDVGGSVTKIGAVTQNGEMAARIQIPSQRRADRLFDEIAEEISKLLLEFGKENCVGIGVGVPGPVTGQALVSGCVNLGWGDIPIERELLGRTGLPVKVENDANLAALGEQRFGAGRGVSDFAVLTIGTGLGAGIIAGGRLLRGAGGAAGEVGHIPFFPEWTDVSGLLELEQVGSATGIVKMAETLQKEKNGKMRQGQKPITAKDIMEAARAGEKTALQIAEKAGEVIGFAAACIGCIANPALFLLGGGVSASGDLLLKPVRESYRKYIFPPAAKAEFQLARLGNNAGMAGAAALFFGESEKPGGYENTL